MGKTKLEIINETVDFYSQDVSRRAILNGSYAYLTKDGKMCAVGRCMKRPRLRTSKSRIFNYAKALCTEDGINQDLEPLLKKAYLGHDILFWKELQRLHDVSSHWCDTGLTEFGKRYVENMKAKWCPSAMPTTIQQITKSEMGL